MTTIRGCSRVGQAGLILLLAGLALLSAGCSQQVTDVFELGGRDEPPEAGAPWTDPATGMEFVWVPAGDYAMGCAGWATGCRDDEKPAHVVAVYGFWMGRFEVTQDQWKTVTKGNPSHFQASPLHPVESVSWSQVQSFIQALNALSEATFRLPTEAEWEYACRSGGEKQLYAGAETPDPVAWYGGYFEGNTEPTTHEVGRKRPNALGLYDMLGNVAEWVEDTYDPAAYAGHAGTNPVVRAEGPNRVVRGGSWEHPVDAIRCLSRGFESADDANWDRGFRLVRVE